MFDKKNIRTYYLMISRKIRNFLLSQKSREFLVFLFFVFVSFCFWLMQTMNDLYQAEFKMPVRLRNVPKEVVLTSELPDEIRVRVEDRGTVLLNYMLGRTFFPVSFDFEEYRDRGDHVHISSAEIFKKVATQLNTSTSFCLSVPIRWKSFIRKARPRKFLSSWMVMSQQEDNIMFPTFISVLIRSWSMHRRKCLAR